MIMAKDGEAALSFQPWIGESLIFVGLIEASGRSHYRGLTSGTVTVCPMPVYVGRCPNPNRPTATAQPNAGGRDTSSRATVATASGGVSTVVVGCSQGRWPEQAPCIRTAGLRASPRVRGPLGCHDSPLVFACFATVMVDGCAYLFSPWAGTRPQETVGIAAIAGPGKPPPSIQTNLHATQRPGFAPLSHMPSVLGYLWCCHTRAFCGERRVPASGTALPCAAPLPEGSSST